VAEKGAAGLYEIGERMETEGYSDAFITKWIMSQIERYYPTQEPKTPSINNTKIYAGGPSGGTMYYEVR
jgi:hypothetical protein